MRELESFSHIWIIFVFHDSMDQGWKPTVRPPRLGGNKRIGVFATRSGFRPNPIGLSPVELTGISEKKGALFLHLKGVDLLDGTPVLDIKPYIPYSDIIENAESGFATGRPEIKIKVTFTGPALERCKVLEENGYPKLTDFIVQMLENDPRPAYHANSTKEKSFANKIFDFDLKWTSKGDTITVTGIE